MNNRNLNPLSVCLRLVLLLLGFHPAVHAAAAPRSPEDVRPLLVGQKIPSAPLRTLNGETKNLAATVKGAYTVLVFYRGGWCPFCNTHLSALGAAKHRLAELGWTIVAISPDRPAELRKSKSKRKIDYALYSDSSMAAARAMGLAFRVDSATLKKYRKYGIDLTQASGQSHNELPVPAVYLVAPDGTVQFQYTNPNYKVRLDHRVLLSAAEAYGPKKR